MKTDHDAVRAGALLAVGSDIVQSSAWRCIVYVAMVKPGFEALIGGSHAPALLVKAVGALCLVLAAFLVTKPRVPIRVAGFARVVTLVSAAIHLLRLGLALAHADEAVNLLEPITNVGTGCAMLAIALCVGSFFAARSDDEASARARRLGYSYLAASVGAAAVLVVGLLHVVVSHGTWVRGFISLVFIWLLFAAFGLIRRLSPHT